MIKLRPEILKLNRCFAEHLGHVQEAKHKPSAEWEEGKSVILDDSNVLTVLSQEMADKLNEEDLKYYLENRDYIEGKSNFEWKDRSTIISSKKAPTEYLDDIGQALAKLSNTFGNLIIMGEWNTPWLYQINEYPPVEAAMNYLGKQIDDQFTGGFYLDTNEIAVFIPHLFWLTRCNASLPEFMMTFEGSKTIVSLCKYGILHLEYYDTNERKEILKQFSDMEFKEVETCEEPVEFDIMYRPLQ